MNISSRRYYSILVLFLAVAIGAGSSIYGLTAKGVDSTDQQEESLPVVGTLENLKELLEKSYSQSHTYQSIAPALAGGAAKEAVNSRDATAAPAADEAADHSTTNLQVEGVDEADLVKTDGEYIYQVSKQQVVIAQAYPPDQMKIASVIKFDPGQMTPQELYLDERYLVVIGSAANNVYYDEYTPDMKGGSVVPPYPNKQTMKAIVYDITDRTSVKQVREVELEGRYVSSRKIDSALYLVAQKYISYYPGQPLDSDASLGVSYRDSAAGSEFKQIGFDQIRYFPDFVEPNYVVIAGLDLNRPEVSAQASVYLGASENIYASPENLYVAVTNRQYSEPVILRDLPSSATKLIQPIIQPAGQTTRVYRFALNGGEVTHKASGEVPGRILNQFSMDEYQGNFRIATTKDEPWRSDVKSTKSNALYVLDDKLGIIGRLENIAPGEKIYSVRFMGGRGYLVTFEKVDPFFVVDLNEPQNPKLLGALKIPGYSDYLHPYDDNHIIGIGKDTVEMPLKDWKGNVTGTRAYYLGMKMAIFDVTDVTQPREVFSSKIGDRGTDSELLRNHKALLFSRDKNLLAFPVTLMEVKEGEPLVRDGMSFPQYGSFSFQGAYVYRIDLEQGFQLRGRITHMSDEDYLKAGCYYANPEKSVERIIYINDTLYTLSPSMIKANSMSDLAERGRLDIQ